jgi:hypothetical protein
MGEAKELSSGFNITKVAKKSWGERNGLKKGHWIHAVDGAEVIVMGSSQGTLLFKGKRPLRITCGKMN